VVVAVNIGALTSASAAASQAAMAAQDVVQRERAAGRQALPSVFTVRVLGFGNEPLPANEAPRRDDKAAGDGGRGALQVVGQMALDAAQLEQLTPVERRNLMRR
jgi:filamentous hemagglutinin